MEREIITIPLITVNSGSPCNHPDPKSRFISENDPAEKVMTDFKIITPITVEPIHSIDRALDKMKNIGVRLLLVTDERDNIGGVITSYDIQGEKPVKYSEDNGISHNNIRVDMIMTPLEQMPAFDIDFIRQSLVRHVISTLHELERPHTLVIEINTSTGKQEIRGMFSSTHISKMLGRNIYDPLHAAHSLADMQHELGH